MFSRPAFRLDMLLALPMKAAGLVSPSVTEPSLGAREKQPVIE
jgi:hypothetical protein